MSQALTGNRLTDVACRVWTTCHLDLSRFGQHEICVMSKNWDALWINRRLIRKCFDDQVSALVTANGSEMCLCFCHSKLNLWVLDCRLDKNKISEDITSEKRLFSVFWHSRDKTVNLLIVKIISILIDNEGVIWVIHTIISCCQFSLPNRKMTSAKKQDNVSGCFSRPCNCCPPTGERWKNWPLAFSLYTSGAVCLVEFYLRKVWGPRHCVNKVSSSVGQSVGFFGFL